MMQIYRFKTFLMTATQAALINHKSYLLTRDTNIRTHSGLLHICLSTYGHIVNCTCICCISKYFINTILLPLAKKYIYFRENHIFFHFLIKLLFHTLPVETASAKQGCESDSLADILFLGSYTSSFWNGRDSERMKKSTPLQKILPLQRLWRLTPFQPLPAES